MGTYNEIHIGKILQKEILDQKIDSKKIMLYFDCNRNRITATFEKKTISTEELLKWSIFLRKDFFRLYSGYLILHRGISSKPSIKNNNKEIIIRKNVYTPEIKKFIVDSIRSEKITIVEAIKKYNIPKTTIYKWQHQI